MQVTRAEGPRRRHVMATVVPLLFAAVLLSGCAQVASRHGVTSPAAVPPSTEPPVPAPSAESDEPAVAGNASTPAPVDASHDTEIVSEDDIQPAEEVEPSPLDELPEVAPEISPSELEKDKKIVAEVAPTFDIPMVLNDQVMAYVEYFQTRHKELFSAGLVRSGRYVQAFQSIFEAAGIPKDLVYMAHVESAFKTNAYSRARAKGIYQFISETGRRYGLRIDSWVDERSDPQKSAYAAAAYLKELHGMFGDWYLALAAYNAGEGQIQRSLAKTKKDDFWQLASTRSLRAETRNYVPAILAATLIAKQPEKFGFDVQLDEPFASDVVKIDGQTDLRILARLANVDVETLRQMNPQLRRGMTPPGAVTDVHVPTGMGDALAQAYAAMPASDRLVLVRHQVAKGETLAFIAHHYDVSTTAVANANRLGKSAALKPGQELIIPAVAPQTREFDGSGRGTVTYRVRKGDTLSRIASEFRTTPAAIASASGIGVRSSLQVGQRLSVPARGGGSGGSARTTASANRGRSATPTTPTTSTTPAATTVVHTVRPGETLYRIADQYQVSVDQICSLNRITPDGVIYPGTRLKIRAN
jgi:membrane-bound lytic murein transglycosylase D